MTQRVPKRAARFTVPNNERVVISIGNERVTGTLSVLSLTGGALRIAKRYPVGTLGEIKIETVSGPITAVIELLSVRGDSIQAFRIVHIESADRKRLESTLDSMRAQGLGDSSFDPLHHVKKFARRLLPRRN
jgi:hypothetical protein